ncbi:MAG: phenylacetate--CoA ligase [Dehalobacter sp. 4CP]|uniref:DVU_1553 family AMP-dependent CoA ligase n=1 Tax=Dehalobacter sp. CP TaxID=2594474 RepID=UPI0013CBBA7C|nr:phenylacetate--CoA ligase [Dehalobacter sp. 4CP]
MRVTPLEDWIVGKSDIKERNSKMLEEYQLNKVRETLYYVKKNGRFYGQRLSNITEDKINTLDDIKNIPFTHPYHIRQNSLDFLCLPQKEIVRIVSIKSSGTSGEEKRIYFSEQDLNLTVDFFKVGMSCLIDQNDRVMVLLPGNTYGSIGDLLKRALEMSKVPCFIHGVMVDPEQTAKKIIENDITCLVGIPMQVSHLSKLKGDVFKSRIKKVLLSTDYVPDVLIHELTHQYGCKIFTHYGMTEMGYGGGVECEALDGYHMREADLYFEIVNPDTGEAVQDGQLGEVVFTTLTRNAMPLIRYRTGDMASFSSPPCDCGTFLKTMKKVLGRMDNKVTIGENKFLFLRELDETILKFKEVLDYKACITDENLLKIEIRSESKSIKKDIEQSIQTLLDEKLGCKMNFTLIVSPHSIPEKIINSMVKRKIIDYRGAGI